MPSEEYMALQVRVSEEAITAALLIDGVIESFLIANGMVRNAERGPENGLTHALAVFVQKAIEEHAERIRNAN